MSTSRLVARSLAYHARLHGAVALGVAAATAVIAGALFVGDSMRDSLKGLTLERLGRIDEMLVDNRFFRTRLVDELSAAPGFADDFTAACGLILLPSATVEVSDAASHRRAGNVLVVGSDESFWNLDTAGVRPAAFPQDDQIVLNQPLADALGVSVGDQVTLRLALFGDIPADSPLGKKAERMRSLVGLQVVAVVPARGLGRFSLRPSQIAPQVAYVARGALQHVLEQPDRINSVLVAGRNPLNPPDEQAHERLQSLLHPEMDDLGLRLQRVRLEYQPPQAAAAEPIYDYFSLTSDRMLLEDDVAASALRAFAAAKPTPVMAYLVNLIEPVDGRTSPDRPPRAVPYSIVAATDFQGLPQLPTALGTTLESLAENEIALSSWAARELQVSPGDRVRLTYFEPETTHGQAQEAQIELKVAAIVPLTEPTQPYLPQRVQVFDQRPTTADDPHWTPEVRGVTDQASIARWEVPFPIDYRRVQRADEVYWENHATTPKAYVALSTAQTLWGSRFGRTTSIRIPYLPGASESQLAGQLLQRLESDGVRTGLEFRPIKRRQLDASAGTTPFDMLFAGLSFFVIVAALLLVALLFRLGIDQRATEIGIVLALGWRRGRVGRWLLGEGLAVAAVGALLGLLLGIGYAWLMMLGLRTWWRGAIGAPFLRLHAHGVSLAVGLVAGLVVSAVTILVSLWQIRRLPARRLLAGQTARVVTSATPPARRRRWLMLATLGLAGVLAALATQLGGEAQAGSFVGAGACFLVALLLWRWGRLRTGINHRHMLSHTLPLLGLANRAAVRHPERSILTVALISVASFLIVAMSAFRLDPDPHGAGGFDLVATSSEPLFVDWRDPAELGNLPGADPQALADVDVQPLRWMPGDDASCTNLYQPLQPRVLGVPPEFVAHFDAPGAGGFEWGGTTAGTDAEQRNPWRLLRTQPPANAGPIPVILDKNTAIYSLKLKGSAGQEFTLTYGSVPRVFRVVGLLTNSVLQGSLLIGEADFVHCFPDVSGYRYFLVKTPPGRAAAVRRTLEDAFSDEGFAATPANDMLRDLLAVQNTYLSAFQSLGGLGLLLGTFGLAAVQLRSVLERRGELALLRAAGFRLRRLTTLVLLENGLLLFSGLATGIVAALLAVLPHMLLGGARIPGFFLAGLLAAVLVAGTLASYLAVRSVLRAPLLAALRGE